MFYRGTIESILSSCITAWFGNCTVLDRKSLQRIVTTAENIIGVSLPSITDMYTTCCILKANNIVDDPTHSSHTLFILLPSGKSSAPRSSIKSLVLVLLENPAINLRLTLLTLNPNNSIGNSPREAMNSLRGCILHY
ncbi:hypothetical protein QTP70_001314 [Hemibagrus guttatus]|uniref:Uncharacterized protein n=1 Tax=Hemibagrus guttatus TaxID=175788 RepID=A0AAE0RB50_9TELE|nr:hypothetical protein QTP70_001314 [Hemibagrus guttatus]